MRELGSGYGGKLKSEHLRELGMIFEERKIESLSSFLDDDIELEEGMLERESPRCVPPRRRISDAEAIRILVDRLSAREITVKDWKFTRIMKQSELRFTEGQLLRVLGGLGDRGSWRQAMAVVEWVYGRKEMSHYKSRFVYTKLLSVLGKARRPQEALRIFKQMRGDCHIYPDMAAYHSIAVTLGQAGMVRELMSVIESMKERPAKTIKNMQRRNWDPTLQPDIVVFNSVLNACVSSHQWKAVSWVFEQLEKGGIKAKSATYGLAMEVMLQSKKYDLVHELFKKMKKSRESPKALTYKVLVRTFWEEGKVDEAIHIVRDMERRGVIGSASVYYELACCLCNKGRWQEAMMEIEKLKKLPHSKPLAYAFTGMILSSMDAGHVNDCVSIFYHMQDHCAPDVGAINAMLKVYGHEDMFFEARELFEKVKSSMTRNGSCFGDGDTPLAPDIYTYGSMLEASGRTHQWEYFEYVYKEMCISGYQLDQGKHAALLVEASRAGKWHLLEHAFDTILEAGEIPHPTLFSEMVCQAMIRDDYEKAAMIISAMVHAPFKLNMKDWTNIFEKNKDRIHDEHLRKLFDMICNHEMTEGSTPSELLKALQSICECVSSGDEDLDCENISFSRSGVHLGGGGDDPLVSSPDYDSDENDMASSLNNTSSFVGESFEDESGDWLDEESLRALLRFRDDSGKMQPPVVLDDEVDDGLNEHEWPSANEILQSWKDMRNRDGIKFSSRFC